MNNKTILITGGTGSFGKRFIYTILKKYKPKKIIVFSRDELKQFEMQQNNFFKKYQKLMRYFLGDVRDLSRLIMALENVDIVIHAAALKQVPAAEYNPFEVVKTNIIGGQNVIEACLKNNVKKVIALSTDKAAAPLNLYGATKLTSDKLFTSANIYRGDRKIQFSVVRYGNVMNSRGSVIPYFLETQNSGVLNITDKNMTRFNITLDEGVAFVLKCIDVMKGGEIFIPKIPSYKILDLAEAVNPDCKLNYIGIRSGEKIHEIMVTKDDALNTIEFKNHFVIVPSIAIHAPRAYINSNPKDKGKNVEQGFSYSSDNNKDFLSVKELRKLIKNETFNAY